jgi:Fur family ferric uptake transcriptional regulator
MSFLLRDTRQRRTIRAILEGASQPLTAVKIHALAVLSIPKLSAVTVYRVLHAFEAEGVVTVVTIPGTVPHYELSRGHHHHFFCRACHQVLDIPCDGHPPLPRISPRFQVEEQQVVLVGLCADCVATP